MVRKTLQAAIERGAEGVFVTCNACFHRRRFDPKTALRLFGSETLIGDIPKRARCKCGAKRATAVAAWPLRSRGGGEPQPLWPKDWGRMP